MLNLYNFLLENRICDGRILNDSLSEEYIRKYAYNVSIHKDNLIMSSKGIGITTLLKSTISYYLLNGFNVIFLDPINPKPYRFMEDVLINETQINTFLGSVGLPKKHILNVRRNEFHYNNQYFKCLRNQDNFIGSSLTNTVVIIDNAENFPMFTQLNHFLYARPYKMIINSSNCRNSQFSSMFNDLKYSSNWNKVKLDYSLNSNIVKNEDILIQKYGEENFNRIFKLM